MAYLNLDLDYFDHPKTKRLVGLLGRGSDVLPVRLWCYCGKYHAETGDMTGYSPTDLESLIGWWGQPGKAVDALVLLRFLDKADAGFRVHDWETINGHIAAFKARAQAGAKAKWEKVRADAQALLKQSLSNAASNALTSPLLGRDKKKIEKKINDVGPEHLMPAKPDPVTIPETRLRMAKAAKLNLLEDPAARFFDEARKVYPGSKGGLQTEWENFEGKNRRDLEVVLPLLAPAISREKEHKAALKAAGLMVPQWKNFQTWINKRCWEQEFANVEVPDGKNGIGGGRPQPYATAQQQKDRRLLEVARRFGGTPGGHPADDSSPLRLGAEGNPLG